MRFRPPALAPSPEARWMLLRAFGPPGAAAAIDPIDPAAALALARRFEVAARIAARQGRERLAAELGPEAAAGFARARVAAAAVSMRLMAAAGEVAAVAAPLGLPLCFLKFAGLEGTGRLAAGSRGACDVDVLAPAGRVEELGRALAAAGWQGAEGPGYEHQLPALSHPEKGVVEVHRVLLGVRLDGGGPSAGYADLESRGLLATLPELPGRCAAPVPEAQAAHALVHGLGQHGFFPSAYSLLKMVADLLDLGPEALTPRALSWVARDVPAEEAEAVRRMCARLAAGEDAGTWDGPEEVLLRHVLAGRLDAEYEQGLRLGLFRSQPSDRGPAARLAHAVWDAVALSDAQIDAVYGRPKGRLGYLGRRLARPFDLLLRLGRYAGSAARPRR